MKDNNAKRYIYWGLTAVCVIAVCIVFWYCIREWKNVSGFLGRLRSIASPIIYGAILAYLISPVYNRVSRAVLKILPAKMKSEKHRQTIAKSMGTIASLFVILAYEQFRANRAWWPCLLAALAFVAASHLSPQYTLFAAVLMCAAVVVLRSAFWKPGRAA